MYLAGSEFQPPASPADRTYELPFRLLYDPAYALNRYSILGIDPPSRHVLKDLAEKWSRRDQIDRSEAMRDYVENFMVELSLEDLHHTREHIRQHATALGCLVGEPE